MQVFGWVGGGGIVSGLKLCVSFENVLKKGKRKIKGRSEKIKKKME